MGLGLGFELGLWSVGMRCTLFVDVHILTHPYFDDRVRVRVGIGIRVRVRVTGPGLLENEANAT